MVTFRVDLDDGGLGAALAQMIARGADLTPAMDSIGQGLEASVIERFNETSRGPDGTPWEPSAAAERENRRTLVKSFNLRDSITHRAAPDEVEVGSNVVYAAIHQFGGKAGRGGATLLPARPYLGLSPDDQDMVRTEIAAFLGFVGGAA